jgi:hypothetical protein
LLEEQGGGGAVETTAAITVQAEALCGRPAAAVLVHPGDRQGMAPRRQGRRQPQAITAAMAGLNGGLARVIEGQAEHQNLHPSQSQQRQQSLAIAFRGGALQRGKGGDAQAKRITAGQTDAATADVEGKGRAGRRCSHSAKGEATHRRGQRPATGLKLFQNGPKAGHAEAGRGGALTAPDTARHQHHLLLGFGAEGAQPLMTGAITHLGGEPQGVAAAGEGVEQTLAGSSQQVLPERMNAQLNPQAAVGTVGEPAHGGDRFVAGGIDEHPTAVATLIEEILDTAIEQLAQLGRTGGLLQVPEQRGGAAMQSLKLQTGWPRGWRVRLRGAPAPELVGALGLETLLPQKGEPVAIKTRRRGEPARGAARPVDGLAQKGGGDLPATGGGRSGGADRQAEVFHLPAAAAAIEAAADDQAKNPLLSFRQHLQGHQSLGGERLATAQGRQQPVRNGQKQGALQQRLKRQEGGIVKKREMPALQGLHPIGRGAERG